MKKTLLTTTAIIAAFAATDANAGNLQVNIGGYADFQAGYVSDDITGQTGFNANANETDFNTDSEIHVSVDGSSDNGLEYGAVLELEANVGATGDKYNDGANADKAYLFVQGGWGRVEMGENTGAEEALAVNTADFASATGGVSGDFYRYMALPTTSPATTLVTGDSTVQTRNIAFSGIVKPLLAMANGGNTGTTANEDATKITYYSPRFAGFQVGASFTPNSADTSRLGTASAVTADNENLFSGGVNYANQFDSVGVTASLTALKGSAKNTTSNLTYSNVGALTTSAVNDIEGYAAGANLTMAGFTIGGSYGDYLDTFGTNADADYYDLGLGYKAGAFSTSLTYFKSKVDYTTQSFATGGGLFDTVVNTNDFTNISLGADYQLAPGLVPYAEVSFFEADAAGTTDGTHDNSGTIVMLGTQLSF